MKAQQTGVARAQEVKTLTSKLSESQANLKDSKLQHGQLAAEEQHLSERVKTSMIKLEEAKSSSQGAHTRNQLLELLMKQSKVEKVKGVFGRLGLFDDFVCMFYKIQSELQGTLVRLRTSSTAPSRQLAGL